MSFSSFCWGLLVGFLLEWLCDWIFWRKARPNDQGPSSQGGFAGTSSLGGLAGGLAVGASAASSQAGGLALPPGIAAFRQDDLEAIEGIGPKIAELLRASGIANFGDLATTPMTKLASILDAGGSRFKLANPSTWAEQAGLAAKNDWAGFDRLKKDLVAGVRSTDV
jgi:hypothetical protein